MGRPGIWRLLAPADFLRCHTPPMTHLIPKQTSAATSDGVCGLVRRALVKGIYAALRDQDHAPHVFSPCGGCTPPNRRHRLENLPPEFTIW